MLKLKFRRKKTSEAPKPPKTRKWIGKIARQKFRFGRGQGYVSAINTMLLLIIAFKIQNPSIIIGVGAGTLLCVWLIGMADDRLRIVHAESNHNIESTTPYFQEMKEDIKEIKRKMNQRHEYVRSP